MEFLHKRLVLEQFEKAAAVCILCWNPEALQGSLQTSKVQSLATIVNG